MLMIVGTGGCRLNLTAASVMIITEEWWNESVVENAMSRLHRQGQQEEVEACKLFVSNSAIDLEIVRVREGKSEIDAGLLEALTVRHDGEPDVPDLLC